MEEFDEIKALELELTDPEIRKRVSRLNELISDSFEEFGSSGKVVKKQELLCTFPLSKPTLYDLSDFKFTKLSQNCVLVKYKSIESGMHALRSSIWLKNGELWQILHHQATVVDDFI